MSAPRTVEAKYAAIPLQEFALNVSVTGEGEVTGGKTGGTIACTKAGGASCSEEVEETKPVTLTATNLPSNWKVKEWKGVSCTGGSQTASTCEFPMPAAITAVELETEETHEQPLTVWLVGEGTVTASAGSLPGPLTCTSEECSGLFEGTVTLEEAPTGESTFGGWIGQCKHATRRRAKLT